LIDKTLMILIVDIIIDRIIKLERSLWPIKHLIKLYSECFLTWLNYSRIQKLKFDISVIWLR